jgi:hypothetical protein
MAASARKAERAGLANALFVQASLEALPPELAGLAAAITVNYPWGSLLKALARPDLERLRDLAGLGRDGAALTALVNMSVFDDRAYCERLDLPCPPVLADRVETRRLYRDAGLEVTAIDPAVREPPHRTTWGRKLVKSGRRRILRLDALVRGARPPGS